jgi:transcriptional regulator with XRE-family HTH domain
MPGENGTFPERIRESFPKRVREARQRANLTQDGLASALQLKGYHVAGKAAVSDWERGRAFPRFGTFLALCEALNQPPAFFFGDAYSERPGPTQEEVLAERVAERVVQHLSARDGPKDIPPSWVDDFLNELDGSEVVREAATVFTVARSNRRGPHELDEVAAGAARRLLERFREYAERRKRAG